MAAPATISAVCAAMLAAWIAGSPYPLGAADAEPKAPAVIMRSAPLAPLRRLPPPQPAPAGTPTGVSEENWIGLHTRAPDRITSDTPTTIIIADDIDFSDKSYDFQEGNTAKNVVLVANEIRVGDGLSFDLSGNADGATVQARSGGNLTILARRLVCEGAIGVFTTGWHDGAHGGDITVAVDEFIDTGLLERWLQGAKNLLERGILGKPLSDETVARTLKEAMEDAELDRAESQQIRSMLHQKTHVDSEIVGTIVDLEKRRVQRRLDSEPYYVCLLFSSNNGHVGAEDGKKLHLKSRRAAIETRGAEVAQALSLWTLRQLEHAASAIDSAVLLNDRKKVVRTFIQVREMLEDNLPELHDFSGIKSRLKASQKENVASLWWHSFTVQQPGITPRPLDAFIEGVDLRTRLAPTEALIRARRVGGRDVLGLISFDPARPDEIVMSFDVELSVDPWLASLAEAQLALAGEEYAGAFTNWNLDSREIRELGIKESSVNPTADGRALQVSLTLDPHKSSLVMWKLASSGGVPLRFDWEYRSDKNFKGEWSGPPLSLARRARPEVILEGGARVRNTGRSVVSIDYVEIDGGRIHAFQPALTVEPGVSVTLPLPPEIGANDVDLPPEAVVYTGLDPFQFEENFAIANGDRFIDKITVTNRLTHNEERGGPLEFVEIELVYQVGDHDSSNEVQAGPYRLAPKGAQGSELMVSFLKPVSGERVIRLSGTAFYEGGSRQTIAPRTFSDQSIKITEELLPPIEN